MTENSLYGRAVFETTSRLIAQLVNEGLCSITFEPHSSAHTQWLRLHSTEGDPKFKTLKSLKIAMCSSVPIILDENGQVTTLIRPNQLSPPVVLERDDETWEELHPNIIFRQLFPWLGLGDEEDGIRTLLEDQLENGAANQKAWFQFAHKQSKIDLSSPSIAWERTLITGHPSHPLHRTCFAQPPLLPILPADIECLLNPEIIFLSLPRSAMRVTGPFEAILAPLLATLEIKSSDPKRIIIPTLARQQPAILHRFPDTVVVGSTQATAQASMRTITLDPFLHFPYHLKLSLACQITSALRTITPWSAIGAPEVTKTLTKLLPNDLWLYKEVATVTGAQANFDDAKHLSCILRTDLEAEARQKRERLIMAAALAQPDVQNRQGKTYAEVVFGLQTVQQKLVWFEGYVSVLLNSVVPPLLNHGVGLEAHGQNMSVRVCLSTKAIKGFAFRDFGGIRLHMPTLHSQGHFIPSMPAGSAITTDDLHAVWNKVHHSLIQNHLGQLLVSLGLERKGGWKLVKEVLYDVLKPEESAEAGELYRYFTKEKMPFKCFLKMSMQGKYRDYVERDINNVLLI